MNNLACRVQATKRNGKPEYINLLGKGKIPGERIEPGIFARPRILIGFLMLYYLRQQRLTKAISLADYKRVGVFLPI